MEWLIYYCVALMFGAVAALFFYYAVKHTNGNKQDIMLYAGIGMFFAALSIAMFVKNGVVIESLLAILMGLVTTGIGLHELVGVITHHIKTEGVLTKIRERRGYRGRIHYELDFRIPDRKEKFTVEYVTSDRRYTVGDIYKIYISKRDLKAYVHRPLWFLLGIFATLFGLLWFSLLVKIITSNF